ncbi:MAG: hypothetical protein KC912_24750 [Proteobacteria bacterium]|nr:hypothetical protein [Pseudomonadota bacterium]
MTLLPLLAACAPIAEVPNEVEATFQELAPGSALGGGCVSGDLAVSYALGAHAEVARYELVLTQEDTTLQSWDLGAEASGSQLLDEATVAACSPSCTASILAYDPSGTASPPLLTTTLSIDGDGDGFAAGSCGGDDCDDDSDAVHPSATETCDGVDNNCSGTIDDLANAPLADKQDGVCAGTVQSCDGNGGWSEPDYTQITGYEATEATCDGLDNDCDGTADDLPSAPPADQQDGVCAGSVKTCDGSGGWTEPDYTAITGYEATETSCDGLDNDCSGQADNLPGAPLATLQDGVCAGAERVCDGNSGFVEPDYAQITGYEATETTCDGLDNDCDGNEDNDLGTPPPGTNQDGVCAGSTKVCDGTNGYIEPTLTAIANYEAVEATCDGLDNDCSGLDDDIIDPPLADKQGGVCAAQVAVCNGTDWVEPDYTAIEHYEVSETLCDGLDNDCDDDVDLDLPGAPNADEQAGVCEGAKQVCDGSGDWIEPNYADIAGFEADESLCDGTDNDCDDFVDEMPASSAPPASKTDGVCAGSLKVCAGTSGYVDPDFSLIADYEVIEASCDGKDNDCDTRVDTVFEADPDTARLECWGGYDLTFPTKVDDGPWAQVAVNQTNDSTGCAIDLTGKLFCWGNNDNGALGDGTTIGRRSIEPVDSTAVWTAIEVGTSSHGLQEDGSLWQWGRRLGNLNESNLVPIRLGTQTYQQISTNGGHGCGIADDDTLWCWGWDFNRELGLPVAGDVTEPTQVGTDTWLQISAGNGHTCGVRTDGTISCWGQNLAYQCGSTDSGPLTAKTVIVDPEASEGGWAEVSAGNNNTCAINNAGSAYCWGNGKYHLFGTGVETDHATPQPIDGGPYESIKVTWAHACARSTDTAGELMCWGHNPYGAFGDGRRVKHYTPVRVGSSWWSDVATATYTSCAIDADDDSLHCWGRGIWNRGTGPGAEAPKAQWDGVVRATASGDIHTCFIDDADGSVWCFGDDRNVGLATGIDSPVPVQVLTGDFISITAGDYFTCAVESDGSRWCWGDNLGRLGDGTTNYRGIPWKDPTGSWKAVEAYKDDACALATDDTIWCWGSDLTPSPVQQGAGAWKNLAVGAEHFCAIDMSDDLWCWGDGGSGAVGDGQWNYYAYADRVKVSEPGPWRHVSGGDRATCAVKSDESLWCWGSDDRGNLGQPGHIGEYFTTPQLVGTGFATVDISQTRHTCALGTDGSPWCWGENSANELGREYDATEMSATPLQVAGPGRTSLGTGWNRTCTGVVEYTEHVCAN